MVSNGTSKADACVLYQEMCGRREMTNIAPVDVAVVMVHCLLAPNPPPPPFLSAPPPPSSPFLTCTEIGKCRLRCCGRAFPPPLPPRPPDRRQISPHSTPPPPRVLHREGEAKIGSRDFQRPEEGERKKPIPGVCCCCCLQKPSHLTQPWFYRKATFGHFSSSLFSPSFQNHADTLSTKA